MNPCDPFNHDFVPLVMERDEHGANWNVSRYCRKCGMVTDDRKMALRLIRAMESAPVLPPTPEKPAETS